MRSNIIRHKNAVESRTETERVEIDYSDSEIVLHALLSKCNEDFEEFLDQQGLDIQSGPNWVGLGVEVILA